MNKIFVKKVKWNGRGLLDAFHAVASEKNTLRARSYLSRFRKGIQPTLQVLYPRN
jgi:hypothetical protein